MSRSERLLQLLHLLRGRRHAVSAAQLAEELSVSIRTVYRDIRSLAKLGAPIEGAAGLGYVLRPGFMLPPLTFSADEIDAIVLGSRMVAQCDDGSLAQAARSALAKLVEVLPEGRREDAQSAGLLSVPNRAALPDGVALARIRSAIRKELRLAIAYRDEHGARTERRIWPVALTYGHQLRLLAAWCELRGAFRTFRVERILALQETANRYPRRRSALLREWLEERRLGSLLA